MSKNRALYNFYFAIWRKTVEAKHQRLMDIIRRLCLGEKLKISSLAKDYAVSTKTIQRDLKERLRSSALIKNGHQFYLKNQGSQEDFILDFFLNLATTMGGEFLQTTQKIVSKYQAIKDDLLFLQLQAQPLTHKAQIILSLQNAIKKTLQIQLTYKNTQLSCIQPYKIALVNGVWYLFAKEGEKMLFLCIQDIEKIKLSRKRFVLCKDTLRRFESEFFKEPKMLISLFVYPELASIFKQKKFASHQKMIEDKDGNLIVEFLSNNLEGIEQEILKNLPHIVVLEPQELKEKIESKVLCYAKKIG